MINRLLLTLVAALPFFGCTKKEKPVDTAQVYQEPHRPQLHFTPQKNWMNDPNGLVYFAGEYHLFYQHYPEAMVWGPMHWGHAVSRDLLHWEHLPIALYPDSIGMIFSGSAVVDKNNTSGLGTESNPPLVAMFTYHNADQEKAGRNDYETQGIAFSLDSGRTWNKYVKNPVIKNPGYKDFRDPKVFWHEESSQWIVTVVAGDHAEFYGSPDLISWSKLGEFGKEYGSHGGVWECPDLFPLTIEGESTKKWILIININPGGPNCGSGTQYFVGEFDGKTFKADSEKSTVSWIDYGPDNYAGITWFNAPDDRTILIGWMSNWAYSQNVPTSPWRSANTLPRDLKLVRNGNSLALTAQVIPELEKHANHPKDFGSLVVDDSLEVTEAVKYPVSTSLLKGTIEAKDFTIRLSNARGQKVVLGYEKGTNSFYIDRTKSGDLSFSKAFGDAIKAARLTSKETINFTIVLDVSSMEVFFDDGLTVMTALYFPDERFDHLVIGAKAGSVKLESLSISSLPSVWQQDPDMQ